VRLIAVGHSSRQHEHIEVVSGCVVERQIDGELVGRRQMVESLDRPRLFRDQLGGRTRLRHGLPRFRQLGLLDALRRHHERHALVVDTHVVSFRRLHPYAGPGAE
jgi:hypothetical protein